MSTVAGPRAASAAVQPRIASHRTADTLLQTFAVVVLVLASGAFFGISGRTEGEGSDPLVLLLWVLAYGVAALLLLDARLRWRRAAPVPALLALFVVLAVASTLWSVAPALTARRSLALVGTVVVGLALAQRLQPASLLDAVRRAMLVVAVASLLLWATGLSAARDPGFGTLRGVVATKNTLGQCMAVGLLGCAVGVLVDRGRLRRAVWSAVPMVLALALTESSAGVITAAFVVGSAVVSAVCRNWTGRALLLSGGLLLSGALLVMVPRMTPEGLASAVGEDTTLTGRVQLWQYVWEAASARPAAGYGYGSFWRSTDEASLVRARVGWDTPHAHNGLLDLVLDLGLLGAVVGVTLLLALALRALQDASDGASASAALRLSIFGVVVLSNLVESEFLVQNSLDGLLLVVGLALPSASRAHASP
ncbi:MAG: O-antigen polymerase [Frankiales bacterium]|nr:O-antigen polymerase [Frankiales bacterium]